MEIFSNSIHQGYFDDAFGHRGTQFLNGKPNRSFHLAWRHVPSNAKSLAIVFIDHDAIPVCGFTWIHWAVANIDPNLNELPENASQDLQLLEGVTSWAAPFAPAEWRLNKEEATGFGGCAPPDKEHLYTIKLFALDTTLNLTRGFYLNELYKAMDGHVLAEACLQATYRPK